MYFSVNKPSSLQLLYYMSRVVRGPAFRIRESKDADRLPGKPIGAFVFAVQIVQFLFYLNTKFQASSHLLLLYSPVCVGPGWRPRRPVFSERGSSVNLPSFSTFNILQTQPTGLATNTNTCDIMI